MELIKSIESNRSHYHEKFDVFHSYISINKEPIYRVYKEDCLQTYIQLYNGHTFWGEDPRPFFYNGRHYVLSQRFINNFDDMENYIVDVFTGQSSLYKVNVPNFSYGKNWSPFIYNDELYIIHSFSPLRILKDNNIILEFQTNLPIDGDNRYTQYRGGTNGIQINENQVVGIGHRTLYYPHHIPFIWILDFEKGTFEIMNMVNFDVKCILNDPTGLWKENNNYYISIFEASTSCLDVPINAKSNIYKIDILECIKNNKNDYYLFNEVIKNKVYHFITFADQNCIGYANNIVESAKTIGKFNKIKIYEPSDLDNDFKIKNKYILDFTKGYGYYLWKPYVILKHLQLINDDEILCYCDSKYLFTDSIKNIKFNDIYLTHNKPNEQTVIEKHFTKGDVFSIMNAFTSEYTDTNQVWAGFVLLKKTKFTINFISEWLKYCENPDLITDQSSYVHFNNFVEHRHDQSILSIVSKKNNIQFVDFPELLYNIRVPQKIHTPTLFDIIIPIGPNDLEIIKEQINYTVKNVINYRNIYIISYDDTLNIPNCITISEKKFPFSIETIQKYHGVSNRNGWYLQQLLKLYAGFIIPDILDKYLVIDADTFFLKPTIFYENGKCLYSYGIEYHIEYFEHMKLLHPEFKKIIDSSGISHHMMFETKYIKEIIDMVEEKHHDLFYNVFLQFSKNIDAGASEYELYFNYMLNKHPDKITIRKLNWENTNVLSNEFDYVSCHWYMRK
jgi:uncharacterized short protein YbdD (DUF466 family)